MAIRISRCRGAWLASLGISLAACGAVADDDFITTEAPVGTTTEALLDGADAGARWLDAVGALFAPEAPELGLCTGTLIGPTTVLTAKHCVLGAASLPDLAFVFALGPDVLAPRATYPISGWATEPQIEPRADLKYGIFGSDVAVARLGAPVTGVRPLAIGGVHAADRGRRFLIAGFGVRDEAGAFGLRQKGQLTLRGIGGNYADYAFGDLTGFIAAAGTLPDYASVPADALPSEYERLALLPHYQAVFGGEPGDAQTCDGDSGAPLLQRTRGGLTVVALAGAGDLASADRLCDFGSVAAVLAPRVRAFLRRELASAGF